MFKYYLPVFIAVFSNIIYDISAKSIPSHIHAMGLLVITYITSALCALILFYITSKEKSLRKELKKVNWAVFVLAVGCTGIDLGYIYLFRVGWPISLGSLVCNIGLAISMIIVGVLLYKEKLTLHHIAGIALCIGGFVMINV